jgi:hypothetical protein
MLHIKVLFPIASNFEILHCIQRVFCPKSCTVAQERVVCGSTAFAACHTERSEEHKGETAQSVTKATGG